jgi:hypothetical protein
MKKILRMKCSNCGHWNRVPVNKIFIQQNTSEPKVKAFIPMYEPLQISRCKKCDKVITEPKELIRIISVKPQTSLS